ncbi:MAG: hypothetical protein IJU69_03965 [Bacteroidales bacterium]|nr:hypothetical protein [Bacteroidales bacterium]
MRKYWILIAALAAAACMKQEVDSTPGKTADEKVWTVEVNATKKSGEAVKSSFEDEGWEDGEVLAATKALILDNDYLSAYWSGTDKVEVYDKNGENHLGTLTTPGGGDNCRFTGTISGSVGEGSTFKLMFPGYPANGQEMYAKQKGTLEDIAKRFDYACSETEVTGIDKAASRIFLSDATFDSMQSITLFNFNYSGSQNNKITRLTVTSWSLDRPVTVIPDTPGTEFYIAIPGKYGSDFDREGKEKIPYDFVAETEDGTVFSGTMKALLADGRFYKATKTLTKYEPLEQPLTIEVLADGKVTIQNPLNRTLYYGFEGVNNSAINSNIASGSPIEIEVKAGDKLLLGGKLSSGNRNWSYRGDDAHIICNVPHYAYGNVMSLIDYEGFRRPEQNPFIQTAEQYAFTGLFWQGGENENTTLYNHPEKDIVLPATTVKTGAYLLMFYLCVNLTRAPELPATTFLGGPYTTLGTPEPPYGMMFMNCVNLRQGPGILPALSVPECCYWRMFEWCTSLEASPVLPAPAPGKYAYRNMFYRCQNLKQITCYAKSNIGAGGATYNWVEYVPAGGSFVSDPSASWPSGIHGIPAGWNGFADPLTIEALEDEVITISNPQNLSITYGKDVSMSMASTSNDSTISIDLAAGEKLRLWGDNEVYGHESAAYLYTKISGSGKHKLSGDIRSLISKGDYTNVQTIKDYAFVQLFAYDSGLVSAQDLILGAASLGHSSYSSMFEGCTSLTSPPALPATGLAEGCYENLFAGSGITKAPSLPATTLAPYCYGGMFRECESLTKAPSLPAMTLAEGCYMNMFDYCTSLSQAPELKAPTLVQFCYAYMFRDCRSLGALTCLATNPDWDWDADEPDYEAPNAAAVMEWMDDIKTSGTFIRTSGVNWPKGEYGVPSDWTITP